MCPGESLNDVVSTFQLIAILCLGIGSIKSTLHLKLRLFHHSRRQPALGGATPVLKFDSINFNVNLQFRNIRTPIPFIFQGANMSFKIRNTASANIIIKSRTARKCGE